jgi:hypothetical protein
MEREAAMFVGVTVILLALVKAVRTTSHQHFRALLSRQVGFLHAGQREHRLNFPEPVPKDVTTTKGDYRAKNLSVDGQERTGN